MGPSSEPRIPGMTGNPTYKMLLAAGDTGHRLHEGESIYALWNNISRIRKAGYQVDCIDGTYILRGKTGKPSQIIVKGVSRSIGSILKKISRSVSAKPASAKSAPVALASKAVYKMLHDAGDKGTRPPVPGKYSFLRYVLQLRREGYQIDCVDGTYILRGKTGHPSKVTVHGVVKSMPKKPNQRPSPAAASLGRTEKKAETKGRVWAATGASTLGDRIHPAPQQKEALFIVNKEVLQKFETLSKMDRTTALLDKMLTTVESFNTIAQIYSEIETIQADFSQKIRDRINTMFPSIER